MIIGAGTVAVTVAGLLAAVTFAAAPASAAANPTPDAGSRKNATQLSFAISGTARLQVDVGTGNALLSDQLVTLPGVTADVPVSVSYNSSVWGTSTPSAATGGTGSGWVITGFDQRLISNSDGSVTYYGPGGLSGVFSPNGAGGFDAPVEFPAALATVSGGGWTLTDHQSQTMLTFKSNGRLESSEDRNGNTTSYGYDGYGAPGSITSSRGATAGRKLTVHALGDRITSLSQTSGSLDRSVSFGYSSNGHLASITDTAGGTTSFASAPGTDTGQVLTITNPDGKTTTLGFTGAGKVSQVAQANPAGAGTSTTRLTYPSSTQTLVADPSTDQGQPVSSVPHTTYTLTSGGSQLVDSAEDPNGNSRSQTYTGLHNVASASQAAGGTTSFSYGANGGESLTQIDTAGGAAASASYGNSGAAAYLPSSSSDDAGNSLQYTYNGQGNQLSSARGTSGPQAKVTYNSDGTVDTSASPGAASGVETDYGYDSNHNLTSITAPTGTGLGARAFTWDGFGRLSTATNGRGDTSTYSYDDADRITLIHNSNGNTDDVTYQYDTLGHVTQRVDGQGTTSYGYDDLGHLSSTSNTANGNTVAYTYTSNGDLATTVTAMGTTSYGYDDAHQLTSMSYPQNGSTVTTMFANDADGRRTDTWLQSNPSHTTWAAHQHYAYDSSGRTTAALGQRGPASSPTDVFDQTLCYSAGASAPSCPTTASADRGNVRWVNDAVSGETRTYSYDTSDQLSEVALTGGSDPRTYSFGYDDAGNRTSASVTGNDPDSQSLSFNAANQISSTGYSYDGSGNQTATPDQSATYNAAGQQTSTTVGSTTSYDRYAANTQNELLRQSTPGGYTYTYTYGRTDRNGQPVVESMSNGPASTGYVLHDPSGKPALLQVRSDSTLLYLYDGLGNPTNLVNNNGQLAFARDYDPYGTATRTDSNGPNGASSLEPYAFETGVRDQVTGQIKFGQRWYNTTTGSWTQQDQLNAPLDPSNANRYTYAAGDPINHQDPTGTEDCGKDIVVGTSAGLTVGATTGLLGGPFAEVTVPAGALGGTTTGFLGGVATCAFGSLYDAIFG